MNNNGIPGLRKLCIFQFATSDENCNLGVYPQSDPENITYPNLFTVKGPFRILCITRIRKSTMKSSCVCVWGGGVHEGHIWPTDYYIIGVSVVVFFTLH